MKFIPTEIQDVIICKPNVFEDSRGYFMESFRQDLLEDFLEKKINFIQDNEAKSSYGVLRGLHYQLPPFAQSKLVKVIYGKVLDVVVDIRKKSLTFGKHISVELSDENKKQLFVPKGFAHGYVVLSDEAILMYKVDAKYNHTSERGIIYNDATLNIDWKINQKDIILSDKDLKQPEFRNADMFEAKEV